MSQNRELSPLGEALVALIHVMQTTWPIHPDHSPTVTEHAEAVELELRRLINTAPAGRR